MRIRKLGMVVLAVGALMFDQGCESRQHSIVRENRYISEHCPEEVAHYWREVPYA